VSAAHEDRWALCCLLAITSGRQADNALENKTVGSAVTLTTLTEAWAWVAGGKATHKPALVAPWLVGVRLPQDFARVTNRRATRPDNPAPPEQTVGIRIHSRALVKNLCNPLQTLD
jgi:hypothetical protein